MNILETYLNELNNIKHNRFFHISTNDLNNKILKPKIPFNTFIESGYENKTIPRISFSTSVDYCLMALGKNIKGYIFNVYEPYDYKNIKIINNDEIIKKNILLMLNILKRFGLYLIVK